MADKRRIHVQKNEKGWELQREGNKRASLVVDTKEEAIARGRKIAKSEKGELIIHKADRNKIQEERTYRDDPYPPPG